MKKTALRLTVFLLSAAMMITAMPLGALALDRQQQEDLYRVGEWSQNPYNQSITWLIDSDNFLYHLDRTGRSIFRDWDYDIMNLNPLERQKNYKDVIVATIDLVHEDIRNMAASELAKEATEGFLTQLISDVAEGEGMIRSVLETIQEAMKLSLEDGAIPIEGMSYQWIEDILVAELGTEDWTKYVKKYFYAIRDKTDWLSKTESFSYALALINSGFQIHKEGIGLIAEYESYFRANEKFNEYLHYIAAQTDDAALRAACNEVRRRMSSDTLAANLTADMVQRMGGVLVENIGVKMFTDILSSSCFGVRMALLGYEAGNFVADELFNDYLEPAGALFQASGYEK